MRHLSADELVDLIEGAQPETSAQHLAACDRCRRQLTELRAAMRAAAEVDVPEPSPLFWDHLSTRVHAAIRSEGPARRGWVDRSPWSRRVAPLSVGAAATIAVVALLAVRVARAPERPPSPTDVVSLGDRGALGDDPALDLVADLTGEIDWETATEIGLATHDGAADKALAQLTDAERVELQRLLEKELRGAGGD